MRSLIERALDNSLTDCTVQPRIAQEAIAEDKMRRRVGIEPHEDWPSYAWPGGYPIIYIFEDGDIICGKCLNDPAEVMSTHFSGRDTGWLLIAADIIEANEGPEDMQCDICTDVIAEGTHQCDGTVVAGHGFNGQGAYAARCDACRYMCAYWDADDIDPDIPFSDNFKHAPVHL